MTKGPEDAPLGATPMLPPPSGAAAERAEGAFKDYLERMRAEGPSTGLQPDPVGEASSPPLGMQAAPDSLPAPDSFAGGRRYDLAVSKVSGSRVTDAPPLDRFRVEPTFDPCRHARGSGHPGLDSRVRGNHFAAEVGSNQRETGLAPEPPPDSPSSVSSPERPMAPSADPLVSKPSVPPPAARASELDTPARPPPGAPFIRPPVVGGQGAQAVSQDLLESAADSAMLRTDPDGTSSFDIAFSDELFSDLACRVTVADGRVVATFRVHDDNTRRLLEAEAGRLRVRLEERGLKVEEVRVKQES